MNEFELRTDLSEVKNQLDKVREQLSKSLKGQPELVVQLLVALLSRGHVLLEGVPGVAKTLAAKSLAKTLQTSFARLQFTPDLMPSDVVGTTIYNQKTASFELRKGPIHAQFALIDEINRAPAKTQAALFEVMEERQSTIDGETLPMPEPFLVIATQNPIEHEGTYRLPEAQLDRFLLKIQVGYPDASAEMDILKMHHEGDFKSPADQLEAVLTVREVLRMQQLCHQIHADEKMLEYIATLVRNSRDFPGIYLGASPRAAIALLNAAKALALIEGRDFITPDDVQNMALPVLRHRILLTAEKEMEGSQTDEIIRQLLVKTEVPR